jgi:hypothetical protein
VADYTRKTHDPSQIRFKIKHAQNRMAEISAAVHTMADELLELSNFLGVTSYEKSGGAYLRHKETPVALAIVPRAEPAKTNGAAEPEEKRSHKKDPTIELRRTIKQWLLAAPQDRPEDIAPLVPAPIGMVRAVRDKLVEAGRLERLQSPEKQQDDGQGALHV